MKYMSAAGAMALAALGLAGVANAAAIGSRDCVRDG